MIIPNHGPCLSVVMNLSGPEGIAAFVRLTLALCKFRTWMKMNSMGNAIRPNVIYLSSALISESLEWFSCRRKVNNDYINSFHEVLHSVLWTSMPNDITITSNEYTEIGRNEITLGVVSVTQMTVGTELMMKAAPDVNQNFSRPLAV